MNKYIKEYDNVLTPDQCAHYINLIEKGRHIPGVISSDNGQPIINTEVKKATDMIISREYPEEVPALLKIIQNLCIQYSNDLNISIPFTKTEEIDGRVYRAGDGYYRCHADATNGVTAARCLTILFYLNTITEGGELEFPEQNRIIKPREGLAVLFPPYWLFLHEAKPSIIQDRYILRVFVRCD